MSQGNSSTFNGIDTGFYYNKRFQPVLEYSVTYGVAQSLVKRCYDYHVGGGISVGPVEGLSCSFSGTIPGDNGNPYQVVNKIDDTRTQNFAYDSLNRIQQAYTNGSNWGQQFTTDSWGNLTNVSAVTGKTLYAGFNAAPATTKNQLTGYTYDAAGNLLNDGLGHSFTYDAENRASTAAGVSYTYDGNGERVEKSSGTLYWTGVGSSALDESDLNGNINEEYVFFNGMRVARVDKPSGAVHYFLMDHLGSSRMTVKPSGLNTVTVEQDLDYTPYGVTVGATPADHYEFTGKERDAESGLDNFGERYFTSVTGRFMTPDWAARPTTVPYGVFGDPQTLNLYTYVENSPLNRVDADGHVDSPNPNTAQTCEPQPYAGAKGPGCSDPVALADIKTEQKQSKKCGLLCGLGQRFSNLFSGNGFHTNEELLPKGTVTTTETYRVREPIPAVTAATDVAGLVVPFAGKAGKVLGPVTSVVSLANDRSPTNIVLNVVPLAVEGTTFPLAFVGAEADLLGATAQHVGQGMINAIPGQTINDGYGRTIPNPAFNEQNICQDLGCH